LFDHVVGDLVKMATASRPPLVHLRYQVIASAAALWCLFRPKENRGMEKVAGAFG